MAILTSFGKCMCWPAMQGIDVKKKRKSHKSQNDFHHGKFIRKKASDVYSHFDSHTYRVQLPHSHSTDVEIIKVSISVLKCFFSLLIHSLRV